VRNDLADGFSGKVRQDSSGRARQALRVQGIIGGKPQDRDACGDLSGHVPGGQPAGALRHFDIDDREK
jgi:hypothetical protein